MQRESDLIQRCREADPQAQREVYEQTVQRIYRLLLKLTRNQEDAYDLAQETYLRAFTQMDEFQGRSSFATWLYRIAVNQALQFLRGQARMRRSKEGPIDSGSNGPVSPMRPSLPAGRGEVSRGSEEQTIARLDLNEALEALSPTDRTILLLRYQEGLDYAAIAEATDCAEGTVASRLNRARQRLRAALTEGYGAGEGNASEVHPTKGSIVAAPTPRKR